MGMFTRSGRDALLATIMGMLVGNGWKADDIGGMADRIARREQRRFFTGAKIPRSWHCQASHKRQRRHTANL